MYQREADRILANGKFVTLDSQGRIVTDLAARVGRIAALGSHAGRLCAPGPNARFSGSFPWQPTEGDWRVCIERQRRGRHGARRRDIAA